MLSSTLNHVPIGPCALVVLAALGRVASDYFKLALPSAVSAFGMCRVQGTTPACFTNRFTGLLRCPFGPNTACTTLPPTHSPLQQGLFATLHIAPSFPGYDAAR